MLDCFQGTASGIENKFIDEYLIIMVHRSIIIPTGSKMRGVKSHICVSKGMQRTGHGLTPPLSWWCGYRSGMCGQFGGSGGECAYMLTYRRKTALPSDTTPSAAVSIPSDPDTGTPIRGQEGDVVHVAVAPAPELNLGQGLGQGLGQSLRFPIAMSGNEGDSGGFEKGISSSHAVGNEDRKGAPDGGPALELQESQKISDSEMKPGGKGGERAPLEEQGIKNAETERDTVDPKLPKTMLAMPMPPHLQTLVGEANEELRRWEGREWDVKFSFRKCPVAQHVYRYML